ncbi:uncharacterized protein LOC129872024 [Solanum dulcamara]|uniref:uncharacterized protein LOC129872024 n=1 Tax=Solanum dulcamara TaxID=45834 RepID=UPI0024869552|nr:uncharacterized protein LOC129872024 [Solanum dulcamara]
MGDGVLRYQERLCIPNVNGLGEKSMAEAHNSRYSIYPGATKIYHDLREMALYKALYERRCRSLIGWFEVGKPKLIGPKLVHQAMEKRVGNIAYKLELPPELAAIHPVFHMSMLKKYLGDPSIVVPIENIGVKDILSYEEIPVHTLDCQVHKLRTKDVASVKVL